MQKRIFLAVGAAVGLAACGETTSPPPVTMGPVGALFITAAIEDPTVDRLIYTITAPDLATPIVGELAVTDGVAAAQVAVPAGEERTLEVGYRSAELVCQVRATSLAIEPGRTAQVMVAPVCAEAADTDRAANRAPRIEYVYASRRSVEIGERVALAVVATDANGDDLSYRWTENVAGFGFDRVAAPATSWKAGPRAVAINRVTITVRDGRGGVATQTLRMDFDGLALGAGTCAAPTRIKVGDSVRGFTVGGTSAHGSTACSVPTGAPEHVFRLDVATRQDVSITATGSAFFARVYVRRGACNAATELACDQFSQRVDLLQAEPGTYYIFVDGEPPFGQGEFQLTVFSGTQPEECRNFSDDDGDSQVDCADSDCADHPGCLECAFECDPNPADCIGGQCDSFSGRCNTFVRFGETCDRDGNPATADVCDFSGQCIEHIPGCGNGILDPGEQCDDGNTIDGDGCPATCQFVTECGNGIFEPGEQCDDGNTVPGDGCDATCQVEQCGPVQCQDFNPCTADVCADATAGTCEFQALPDGTSCELDGIPGTTESCQAGTCQAPAPDVALLVLDPAVLADPAFSLAAMHDRLASDGDGPALFDQWATTLTAPMTTNGRTVAGRPGFAAFFAALPRDAAGRVDIDAAGFLPSAMVNRFDLRQPGNCGENRLVFTKTSAVTNAADRGTLIFEFAVPDDGSNCATALAPWLALRTLEGPALRAAAVEILESFAQPLNLNQFRTNEFVNAPFWELREFHLVDGELQPFPVLDSVPFELATDPAFRTFVVQNSHALNHGAREIGTIPTQFLAPASRADGTILSIGNLVPSVPGLEANLNILSCSGCHLTNAPARFVHIEERPADRPSVLSPFLRSELEFRGFDLAAFASVP